MRAGVVCQRLSLIPFVISSLRRPHSACTRNSLVSFASSAANPSIEVTSFLTDVEGNLDYFHRYVEISEVLSWSKSDPSELELADGSALVFGGDALDKGIGDIRFSKALLRLARRHPGRVEFLLGNRDVNKLRIPSELHDECLRDEAVADDRTFPYWLQTSDIVTPAAFLSQHGMDDTKANRLRWMLKETMGAEGAFERRAAELAIISGKDELASDDAVVESYLTQVTPGHRDNFVLDLLSQGKLLHRFGPHLFVHGAVTERNYGTVPGSPGRTPDLDSWVKNLNGWARAQVEEFASSTSYWEGKNSKGRAGHGLMDYGVPGGNGGATVVYGRWEVDEAVSEGVSRFLSEAGVSSVLCGHTPVGNSPAIAHGRGVTVVSADTSYSEVGHESSWGVDNRGHAVSEVLAYRDGRIRVHGRLEEGTEVEYEIGAARTDELVGRQLADGWAVRARLQGSDEFLLSRGLRPVEYRRVSRQQLQGMRVG